MSALYPLRLSGVTKSPIWSGKRLCREWNKGEGAIGESWELCVRKNENSVVVNGELKGKTVAELIRAYGTRLTGKEISADEFPLLVKLIDAGDDLSVQVHPDDAYANRVENDRGKTEMWHVIDAEEGASIICGLREGVSPKTLAIAFTEGKALEVLNRIPVRPGDTFFIPAGIPHAIGKGILLAEIQQNCDLTYRLYDYGRIGADKKPRELHIKKALDVIQSFSEGEINAARYSRACGKIGEDLLADCEYFKVRRMCVTGTAKLDGDGVMRHLLVLSGEGAILHGGAEYPLEKGSSYLLPAALEGVELVGEFEALVSE